jgi:putative membrane-bound dehydrogenase-like protein
MLRPSALIAALLCGATVCAAEPTVGVDRTSATSEAGARNASEQLQVAAGFSADVFAAPEQIANPASIDVDDRGRVWVLETVNYRKKTRDNGDRILILADRDGDGAAEDASVFFQGHEVDGGHGICVLHRQVIVSTSDRILVFEDSDGDDRADGFRVLFQADVLHGVVGQHDHAMHAAMFGPDGRLIFNFGNSADSLRRGDGSKVQDVYGLPVEQGGRPYREGMVLRCDIDGSRVEMLGHNFRNNWEVTVDSFGSLWQSDNDNGSASCRINYVMEHGNYGYTDEMTGMGYQTPRTNMEPTIQGQMWHQNDPGVVPNVLITGQGAPTGMVVYEGDLLPAEWRGQIIHTDAGRKAVWGIPVSKQGAGYTATIQPLVVGGSDDRFRPCDVAVAPDGSLFVADWHDPIDCCHRTLDDTGRILRVAPSGKHPAMPAHDYTSPRGAIAALRSPNQAARYRAWMAIKSFNGRSEAVLRDAAADPDPRLRARALWLLAAIGQVNEAIAIASQDRDDDVRTVALRIARQYEANVEPLVARLAHDTSPLVRRECAVALHRRPSPLAARLWSDLAMQHDGRDRWYLEALGIGAQGHDSACFTVWMHSVGDAWSGPAGRDIVWRSRAPEAADSLVRLLLDEQTADADRRRFMRALDFHDIATRQAAAKQLLAADLTTNAWIFFEALQRCDFAAIMRDESLRQRVDAAIPAGEGQPIFVDLVARFERRDLAPQLMRMAAGEPPSEAGRAALRQLLAFQERPRIEAALADPVRRDAVVAALGGVDSVESTAILAALVTDATRPETARRLAVAALGKGRHGSRTLHGLLAAGAIDDRVRADALTAMLLSPDLRMRAFAVEQRAAGGSASLPWTVQDVLEARPDPGRGKDVFKKAQCDACHAVDGEGKSFGPELSAIGSKLSREELITAIINPSQSILLGYEGTAVILDDGRAFTGIVSGENAGLVRFWLANGEQIELPTAEIDSRERLPTSLMPVGLVQGLTLQEFADLLGWLGGRKALPADAAAGKGE